MATHSCAPQAGASTTACAAGPPLRRPQQALHILTQPVARCTSSISRRHSLLALVLPAVLSTSGQRAQAAESARGEGAGTSPARLGDLVLVHYVGTLEDGTVFDSTRGGLRFRDGGKSGLRPVTLRLGSGPMPGIVARLSQGILGMRVGSTRSLTVAPAEGFGSGTVLAPFAVVPPESTLRYEVELVRLSRRGPDALMSGVAGCGLGGASERTQGCGAITAGEFL